MGDTFNEFVSFITDDPLMLGLCIAVVVLIVLFILVLALGAGKKGKAKAEAEAKLDNTKELLKSDIKEEPLKSTQEFNLENLAKQEATNLDKTINVPNVESVEEDIMEKEAPINIDEAMILKNARQTDLEKDTIPVPIVNPTMPVAPEVKAEPVIPAMPEMKTEPSIPDVSVFASAPETPVAPIIPEAPVAPEMPEVTTVMDAVEPEAPVLNEMDDELPTMVQPKVGDETRQFSSVYVNANAETAIPKPNEDFSKTEIIRHMPTMEEPVFNENIDDDLPRLNNDTNTSVIGTLTGESFNIK